jgi:hypothetical protein
MTVTVTATATRDAGLVERASTDASTERLFEPGGTSLEDVVLERWDRLVVDGRTPCLVCGGSMSAAAGCDSCGAELS